MTDPVRVDIALGSNLGDRHAHFAAARTAIAALPGTTMLAMTVPEETPPLGNLAQPPYLNQMVRIQTSLGPHALLDALLAIETAQGRRRSERWASRTLDLDIVRYGDLMHADDQLTLPHPGLADRDFWRRELAELDRS